MVVRTHLIEGAIWHHRFQSNFTVVYSKYEKTVGTVIKEILAPKLGTNYPTRVRTKYITFYYYLVA